MSEVERLRMTKFAFYALAIVAVLAVAIWEAYPRHAYRFKLTIAAEVDGEIRSASSVIEITSQKQPQFVADVPPYSTKVEAEAVYLDLGNGRNVVATLGFGPVGINFRLASLVPKHFDVEPTEVWSTLAYTDDERVLSGADIPTLVTFADVNDPDSGRVVKPEDFSRVFGEDVRFAGAKIQMTRNPVTNGIENDLPMLVTHQEYMSKLYSHPKYFRPIYIIFVRNI